MRYVLFVENGEGTSIISDVKISSKVQRSFIFSPIPTPFRFEYPGGLVILTRSLKISMQFHRHKLSVVISFQEGDKFLNSMK